MSQNKSPETILQELDIAKNALEQIVGYYRRSHKHGKNTCYMMCLEAESALREMGLLITRMPELNHMAGKDRGQ